MRLLVTRPEPDAERTAAALRARGHRVLCAPLMRLTPLERPDLSTAWAGVIVTSANAIRVLDRETIRALSALPLIAVGERTAQTARAAGFVSVQSADGDADDAVRLAARVFAGAKTPVLYLAGEVRAHEVGLALEALAIRATTVAVYRMEVAAHLPKAVEDALSAGEIDGVLHYSRRSAEVYLACAASGGGAAAALRPIHYGLSREIGLILEAAGAPAVKISPRPDETSLLALIVNE